MCCLLGILNSCMGHVPHQHSCHGLRIMLSACQCYALVTLMTPCLPSADQSADTEGTTISVQGFDKYLGEEAVRQQLTETFAECGVVSTVRLPRERESGELKGIGFIEFGSVQAKVCTAVHSPLACLFVLHVCALQSCAQHSNLQLCLRVVRACQSLNSNRSAMCPTYTPLKDSCCLQWHAFLPLYQMSGSHMQAHVLYVTCTRKACLSCNNCWFYLCLSILYKVADWNHALCRTRLLSLMAQRQQEAT